MQCSFKQLHPTIICGGFCLGVLRGSLRLPEGKGTESTPKRARNYPTHAAQVFPSSDPTNSLGVLFGFPLQPLSFPAKEGTQILHREKGRIPNQSLVQALGLEQLGRIPTFQFLSRDPGESRVRPSFRFYQPRPAETTHQKY